MATQPQQQLNGSSNASADILKEHSGQALPHHQYHAHATPQMYGKHADDNALHLTATGEARNLAAYNESHAAQLAANKASHSQSYQTHATPQMYGQHADDNALHQTPTGEARNLAAYNETHAAQLAANKASHESHSNYHTHQTPGFYNAHTDDNALHLTATGEARNLAAYNESHADQLAANIASHTHPGQPHYHTHSTPQIFSSGSHGPPGGEPHLTAEQNAANLAAYNASHAELLAHYRASHHHHGGHGEGTPEAGYTPSKAAHHLVNLHLPHPHYQKHPKGRSGANTPK